MAAGSWKPCPPAGPCTPNCKSLLNDRFILLRLLIVFTSIHFIPSSKEGGRALGPWHLQSAPVLSPLTVMCSSNDTVSVCVLGQAQWDLFVCTLCECLFDKKCIFGPRQKTILNHFFANVNIFTRCKYCNTKKHTPDPRNKTHPSTQPYKTAPAESTKWTNR